METASNQAALQGTATAAPQPSHSSHGVVYYLFPLSVRRLSGTADVLNVVIPEGLLNHCPIEVGREYRLTGEIRSFNNRSGVGNRLVITFFARTAAPAQGEDQNDLELTGVLCKAPVLRRTPLGREICDLLLAVNRRYGRADYLPCIAWGSLARSCTRLQVGDTVHMTGRLQSRVYHKQTGSHTEERTAYEVSILELDAPE